MNVIARIIILLMITIPVFSNCTGKRTEVNNTHTAASSEIPQPETVKKHSGLPVDAISASIGAPGYMMAGPVGTVSIHFGFPSDDQVITATAIAPTVTLTGYPVYRDTDRNKGQHLHMVLDNGSCEEDFDTSNPFSPEKGAFNDLKEGTHTLRVFPVREWHESIKQVEAPAFDFVVFHVKTRTPRLSINTDAPILTYSQPAGEYKWDENSRGVLLDFYVANAELGPKGFKVRYVLDGKQARVLTQWSPVWLPFKELGPGEHRILLELLGKDDKHVTFLAGNVDYNKIERTFKILPPD